MPKGPRGERRPVDAIARAVMIGKIATGEIEDEREMITTAAAEMGRRGGKARAERMSPERRAEIARAAAASRWAKTASKAK
ncbi:MAG: RNA-binding protein [Alphaproteobacteria bacterium]|nr:RNA-binding protein [Alphaproteobacteria bacterium]MBV9371987.1 RNA-binding protein [Alphaproteobacteria bacterium]MBV9902628.1 RNA-binding protein [Alphaproteobacteria bacterium]